MWWKIVCDTINGTPTNCSWSGSRVEGAPKGTTAKPGCSDKRVEDVGRNGTPDMIFCYIGCNDWGNSEDLGTWSAGDPIIDDSQFSPTDTVTTFSDAYALMLNKLKTAYPTSTIYCFTILDDTNRDVIPGAPSDNRNGVTIKQWNDKIKEIAKAMKVKLVDLHECGITYDNASTYLPDGLHPNAAGMEKMATYTLNTLYRI